MRKMQSLGKIWWSVFYAVCILGGVPEAMADESFVQRASDETFREAGIAEWRIKVTETGSVLTGCSKTGNSVVEMVMTSGSDPQEIPLVDIRSFSNHAWSRYDMRCIKNKNEACPILSDQSGDLDPNALEALRRDLPGISLKGLFMAGQCDVDWRNIWAACGGTIVEAIICGRTANLQACLGTTAGVVFCSAAIRQGCLDQCINPYSFWCR